jgi:hypothetical protein
MRVQAMRQVSTGHLCQGLWVSPKRVQKIRRQASDLTLQEIAREGGKKTGCFALLSGCRGLSTVIYHLLLDCIQIDQM